MGIIYTPAAASVHLIPYRSSCWSFGFQVGPGRWRCNSRIGIASFVRLLPGCERRVLQPSLGWTSRKFNDWDGAHCSLLVSLPRDIWPNKNPSIFGSTMSPAHPEGCQSHRPVDYKSQVNYGTKCQSWHTSNFTKPHHMLSGHTKMESMIPVVLCLVVVEL